MKRVIAIVAGLRGLVAAAIGGLAMSMAWQHNPQDAFHESVTAGGEVIHGDSWGLVGDTGSGRSENRTSLTSPSLTAAVSRTSLESFSTVRQVVGQMEPSALLSV